MTRALDHSKMSRKSSVKGTQAFMPPEGLVYPLKYDDKLDVFSYGNIIVTTVTHQWPEPGPSKEYQGDHLIAVSELQRRQQYIAQFSQEEGTLLLPTVRSCLEDRPGQRPTSIQLVDQMRQIEASHPREMQSGGSTIAQLREQLQHCRDGLQAKVAQLNGETNQAPSGTETIAQLRVQLQRKDTQLHLFHMQLQQNETQFCQCRIQLQEMDTRLKQKDEDSGQEYALLLQENQQIQQERDQLKHERDQLRHERDQFGHQQLQGQVSTHQQFLKASFQDPVQPTSTHALHRTSAKMFLTASKQVSKSFLCMCVCMDACVRMCMCMCLCVCLYTCACMHVCTMSCIHAYILYARVLS